MLHSFLLSISLLFSQTTVSDPPVLPKPPAAETTIFQSGEGGYQCYRIPAIVKAPNGNLLAFAEGRRKDCDDFGDIDIVMRISQDNGQTWGPLQLAADNGTMQAGNPAPVFDLTDKNAPQGKLFLLYNTGIVSESEVRKGNGIREIWYKTSTDGGQTWTDAVNITTQVSKPRQPDVNPAYAFPEDWRWYANTPGHALQIKKGRYKGRIFVAANHTAGPAQPQFRDCRAHGFYSDDHGKTWKLTPDVAYPGSNESTAAETSDGGLLINSRNQSGDVKNRLLAMSHTAGESWEPVRVATDLPDPVCEGSLIDYQPRRGKRVLLFSNLNHQTKRENITIRVSTDDGKTWSGGKAIYSGSSAYSDLVIQKDGNIGILYEKDRYSKIVYTNVSYKWLVE